MGRRAVITAEVCEGCDRGVCPLKSFVDDKRNSMEVKTTIIAVCATLQSLHKLIYTLENLEDFDGRRNAKPNSAKLAQIG